MKKPERKLGNKVFFLLLIVANLLLVFVLFNLNVKPTNQIKEGYSEISAILNSKDANFQRNKVNALTRRIGSEEAILALQNSGVPFTGVSHILVHEIGSVAYKLYGKDALLKCKDYYNFGCYHGVIIEAASSGGQRTDNIKEMVDSCKGNLIRFAQCVHAVGHGYVAMWDYDLPQALADCDKLFEGETRYVNAVYHCHDGAFMENIFGLHDSEVRSSQQRKWLSETDMYFPCSVLAEKYQHGCWLNQASRIFMLNDENIKKTALVCESLANAEYEEWCFNDLGRRINPLTVNSVDKVYELCSQTGQIWEANCAVVNAVQYYAQGNNNTAIQICFRLDAKNKDDCFGKITQMIAEDLLISRSDKEVLCAKTEEYQSECSAEVGKQRGQN